MPLRAVYGLVKYSIGLSMTPTEKTDVLRFSLLMVCVTVFNLYVDFSVLYHYLRAQSLLKLYFIYNMLEILERLVRSWGSDLMDSVIASVAEDSERSIFPQWLASVVYSCVHAHMHFWRVLLVSVALVSSDSSIFMIVITNNFAEVKGTVFKKYELRSLYPVLSSDIVERLYLLVDLSIILFSLLTSPQKRRMPLGDIFFWVAAMTGIEVVTDWIKYMCICKFNQLPSSVVHEYHQVHLNDVIDTRSSDSGTLHFKGVVSFSHGSTRRLHFQSLPLAALVLFQLFTPSVAGAVWPYRGYVFCCCLVSKLILGIYLYGEALKHQAPVKDRMASVKAL